MQRSAYKQRGVTTVEFALVGLLALTMLFACIEVARLLFTVNLLQESTRRAARMATVCQVDDPAIARAGVFNSSGAGTSGVILPAISTNNIRVQYLNAAGAPVQNYAADIDAYLTIEYVQVDIVDFQYRFLVPGFEFSFVTRGYPTVMPRESLGVPRPDQTSTCT